MIKIIICFISKNLKSFKKFLIFLNFLLRKIKAKKKINYAKKKKSFFSILKSPHVNKKAQDQFTYTKHSKNISVCTTKYKEIFLLIKKLNFRLFTDVELKIKININENINKQTRLKIFNPSNFKINLYNKNLRLKLLNNLNKFNTKK